MPNLSEIFNVEIVPLIDVAKALHTTPEKITAAILNGTFPVGITVPGNQPSTRTTTIILKNRLEAFLQARDLVK